MFSCHCNIDEIKNIKSLEIDFPRNTTPPYYSPKDMLDIKIETKIKSHYLRNLLGILTMNIKYIYYKL